MSDRPDPDLLLAEVRQQEAQRRRGRLKIFFGMSAGVGKTYAMLEEARQRATEGVNVLIGYAESHIRPDTEALLLGLEILPYKLIEYRGATLKEFDLDAALARKPSLVCVDELAHTNAPDLRHAKRWQDVAELLDAGVQVYTSLNVQHLESVNDLIERITGVRVRETLPDSVLEAADEVELIDISPDELLERFREGKVYRPDQAERASNHFFTKGNLLALRELALRKTAERVDEQVQAHRRDQRLRQIVPASEKVLVCIGPSPLSARLVRSARRLATSLRATLVAVYVQTPRSNTLNEANHQRLEQNLRLAEELGATTVSLNGRNIADEVIAYATANNVTKIVVGKPVPARWRDVLLGSVVDDLVRRSGEIDIYVIRGGEEDHQAGRAAPAAPRSLDWKGHLWALLVTTAATLVGWPLYHGLGIANENILMLYLLGVMWIAMRHSRAAAVAASVLSVAAFDLTFVAPFGRFSVSDQQYVVTFAAMLVTALVISTLTHRVRVGAEAARKRESRTASLLNLSRDLSVAKSVDEVLAATSRHVSDILNGRAVPLLPDETNRLVARPNGTIALDAKEMSVAQWAFEHDEITGRGTATLPAAEGTYIPLRAPRGTVGVLAAFMDATSEPWLGERKHLVQAFASQAALALERANLADEARSAWERVEAEFLRNTLLSGVSHELRTPLAGITGAASTLIEAGPSLSPEARSEMLETIQSEAERMDRLVNNLLDMTRLESGGLALNKEWLPLEEVIGSALHHLKRRIEGRDVQTYLSPGLPLVQIDAIAMEQVLTNLIDNAVEYTPRSSPIELSVTRLDAGIAVEVSDRGPGLPAGTEKRVFDKFFRARPVETRRGIGLGLAIARSIVQAHGGTIAAWNRPGGGAVFRFTIPLNEAPPAVDASA